MNERAEILRRQVALYRRYLSEGIDAELARYYLHELVEAEAELAGIEPGTDKREWSPTVRPQHGLRARPFS